MDYRITFIIPNIPVVESVKTALEKIGLDYPVYLRSTGEAVELARELIPRGVKLIVSHGLTLENIRKELAIPAIDLPFSGLDALATARAALQLPGRIVHLGTQSLHHYIQRSLTLIGENPQRIDFYQLKLGRTVEEQAQDMIDAGYNVFIGGYSMVAYVKQAGKYGLEFDADELIIEATVQNAQTLLNTILQREQRNELDRAILQASSDAIIAIDQDRRIFNINPTAIQTFQRPEEELLGRVLEDAMQECGIINVENVDWKTGSPSDSTVVILRELPVTLGGLQRGSVISIKQMSEIRDLELQVRKAVIDKGFTAKKHFSDIVGASPAILQVKAQAEAYAPYDSAILICGETGTGKEVFAQSIHNASKRKNEAFVAINCATLPENLIESELFGHAKGAFTGASREGKQGLFEIANKGTIFLDEISELPISVQAKLLRVIQEGEFMRVGGDKLIQVDVRVICSSNRDLLQLIEERKFKADLYYRLSVLEIDLPPLRDRPGDIEQLAQALVWTFSKKHQKNVQKISDDVLRTLKRFTFPGNVRELGNIIERMTILENGTTLTLDTMRRCNLRLPAEDPAEAQTGLSPSLRIQDAEHTAILAALKKCCGNKAAAARMLGISYSTLWRKLKQNPADAAE